MTGGDGQSLRFGIISTGVPLQSWQEDCLQRLLALPQVTLAAVLLPDTAPQHRSGGWLFERIWGRVAVKSPPHSQLVRDLIARSPVLRMNSGLKDPNLDFIICFADVSSTRDYLGLSRYGIWTFIVGDWESYRGQPGGFWEIYTGASTTSAMLARLTEDPDSVIVLRRGCLRTKRMSFRRNRQHVLSRITHWPAQACIDIRNGEFAKNPQRLRSSAAPRANPTTLQVLAFGIRILRFAAAAALRNLLRYDQWNVGIVRQPIREFLDPTRPRPSVEWLPARPRREFIADPFGVYYAGKLTIICEYLDCRIGAGVIAALHDPDDPALTPVSIGPQPPVHLSFPFLIEHDGRILCIPETSQAREVALYAAEHFPDRWTRVATLLANTEVADVTVFRHGNRWWLAGADPGLKSPSADLFLWHSESIEGPWQAHGNNPVKTDVRSARPAGTPFVVDGVLYRPTMDCSETYGGRVHINRIHTLTPTAFHEEVVATVEPDLHGAYSDGLHTLSAVGELTLIDGKRSIFIYEEFRRTLASLARKLRQRR